MLPRELTGPDHAPRDRGEPVHDAEIEEDLFGGPRAIGVPNGIPVQGVEPADDRAGVEHLAVDLDGISELDALADVRRLVVDRNPAFKDELLHLQARTEAGLGQDLVQLWALGLRRQHPLVQLNCRVLLVGVELSGDYVFKAIALSGRCAWLGPGRAALSLIALIGRTGLCARPRTATAPPVRPLALTGLAGLVLRRWL